MNHKTYRILENILYSGSSQYSEIPQAASAAAHSCNVTMPVHAIRALLAAMRFSSNSTVTGGQWELYAVDVAFTIYAASLPLARPSIMATGEMSVSLRTTEEQTSVTVSGVGQGYGALSRIGQGCSWAQLSSLSLWLKAHKIPPQWPPITSHNKKNSLYIIIIITDTIGLYPLRHCGVVRYTDMTQWAIKSIMNVKTTVDREDYHKLIIIASLSVH